MLVLISLFHLNCLQFLYKLIDILCPSQRTCNAAVSIISWSHYPLLSPLPSDTVFKDGDVGNLCTSGACFRKQNLRHSVSAQCLAIDYRIARYVHDLQHNAHSRIVSSLNFSPGSFLISEVVIPPKTHSTYFNVL
jgi:hypothetical protein